MSVPPSFATLSAAERARALTDPDTFVPRPGFPQDGPLTVGSGRVAGRDLVLALVDGQVRGGTLGVREATLLDVALGEIAADRDAGRRTTPLVLGFDTGGVRVEEGPGALAAVSAVGVALARMVALGVPVASVISGPRGCFGAPSVMAALPPTVIMTADARWGLTGPRLIEQIQGGVPPDTDATSSASRLANGDATEVAEPDAAAVRAALCSWMSTHATPADARPAEIIRRSRDICTVLADRLHRSPSYRPPAVRAARPRDLLRYSFRGQWHPEQEARRTPLLHAAVGRIGDHPALSMIIGPEQADGVGVGIDEAKLVTEMLAEVSALPGPPALILSFVFCQGHVVDFTQERFGLPRALAECLRALVAARMRGHSIVTTLGGGTYGAAYLAFAAPSHRVLALRGTSVAPMAPEVLRAFQELRGRKPGHDMAAQLAERIPSVRTVESVIRLPRVLRAEIEGLLGVGATTAAHAD